MPNTSKPAYYNKAEIRFLIDQHLKGSPMNVGARDKRGHIRLAVATDLLAEIDASQDQSILIHYKKKAISWSMGIDAFKQLMVELKRSAIFDTQRLKDGLGRHGAITRITLQPAGMALMNTLRRYETDEAFKAQVKQSLDQLAYPDQPTVAVEPLWNNKTDIGCVSDVCTTTTRQLPNDYLTTTSGILHSGCTASSTVAVEPLHSGCTTPSTVAVEPLPLRTLQEHNQEQIQENKELSSSLRSEPSSREEEKVLLSQTAEALIRHQHLIEQQGGATPQQLIRQRYGIDEASIDTWLRVIAQQGLSYAQVVACLETMVIWLHAQHWCDYRVSPTNLGAVITAHLQGKYPSAPTQDDPVNYEEICECTYDPDRQRFVFAIDAVLGECLPDESQVVPVSAEKGLEGPCCDESPLEAPETLLESLTESFGGVSGSEMNVAAQMNTQPCQSLPASPAPRNHKFRRGSNESHIPYIGKDAHYLAQERDRQIKELLATTQLDW